MEEGSFTDSEILVMLGENGTGKTTFIRMLAGMLPPDDEERTEVPEFNVSYKPQKISPKFTSTVSRTLGCAICLLSVCLLFLESALMRVGCSLCEKFAHQLHVKLCYVSHIEGGARDICSLHAKPCSQHTQVHAS